MPAGEGLGQELALSARSNRNRKERRNICVHVRD